MVVSLDWDVGLLPAADPSLMEVTSDGLAMSTLSSLEEGLELGEDFFIWPHPMALFVVDNASE